MDNMPAKISIEPWMIRDWEIGGYAFFILVLAYDAFNEGKSFSVPVVTAIIKNIIKITIKLKTNVSLITIARKNPA